MHQAGLAGARTHRRYPGVRGAWGRRDATAPPGCRLPRPRAQTRRKGMKPMTWTTAVAQWMVRTGAGKRGLAAAAAIAAGAALLGGGAVQADTPAADGRVAREYR